LADVAILHDVTERVTDFAMIEMQRKGRGSSTYRAFVHQDVIDWLGLAFEPLPQTQHAQHADRCESEGGDTSVKALVSHLLGGHRVGNRHLKSASGKRDGECQADHPAACDHDMGSYRVHGSRLSHAAPEPSTSAMRRILCNFQILHKIWAVKRAVTLV